MILQTAGNGTQAVRGLGQAGNPWNPPMVVVFWAFQLGQMDPSFEMNVKQVPCKCGNKGFFVREEISYVFLWLKLFKPQLEVFPLLKQFPDDVSAGDLAFILPLKYQAPQLSTHQREIYGSLRQRVGGAVGAVGVCKELYTHRIYIHFYEDDETWRVYIYTYIIISLIWYLCILVILKGKRLKGTATQAELQDVCTSFTQDEFKFVDRRRHPVTVMITEKGRHLG